MIDNLRRVSGGHASLKIENLWKIEVQMAYGFNIIEGGDCHRIAHTQKKKSIIWVYLMCFQIIQKCPRDFCQFL